MHSQQSAGSPTSIRPPFTEETARAKVKAAQDGWNSRDPERVALAYSENSEWRNRDEFFSGREAIKACLWSKRTARTQVTNECAPFRLWKGKLFRI